MEIKISVEELKKRKLFLATPMYGGQCFGMYAKSVMDLASYFVHYGLTLRTHFLFNESLITRARNYCVDEFLRSDCTHMMFIDSDIGFNAQDVLALLSIASEDSPYDIIGAPYPKKCIAWEKIKVAVDKGFAEDNPENLSNFVGDFVFNPKANVQQINLLEPSEVLEIGTGFMLIQRRVFEQYAKAFPELSYKPDHVRTEHFDGSREIMAYFDCIIDPESKRYLSEDYMFCQNVQKFGGKIWLCPWMKLQHVGTHVYGGSLLDMAQLGVSATADVNMLKKGKEIQYSPATIKQLPPPKRSVNKRKKR